VSRQELAALRAWVEQERAFYGRRRLIEEASHRLWIYRYKLSRKWWQKPWWWYVFSRAECWVRMG
jgi:hypothetical protein